MGRNLLNGSKKASLICIEGPTGIDATLDLTLANEVGQAIEVFVGEHFGINDHNSISLVMESDIISLQVNTLIWGKADFEGNVWKLAEFN